MFVSYLTYLCWQSCAMCIIFSLWFFYWSNFKCVQTGKL